MWQNNSDLTLHKDFETTRCLLIFFDLEDPDHLNALENPKLVLNNYQD